MQILPGGNGLVIHTYFARCGGGGLAINTDFNIGGRGYSNISYDGVRVIHIDFTIQILPWRGL